MVFFLCVSFDQSKNDEQKIIEFVLLQYAYHKSNAIDLKDSIDWNLKPRMAKERKRKIERENKAQLNGY